MRSLQILSEFIRGSRAARVDPVDQSQSDGEHSDDYSLEDAQAPVRLLTDFPKNANCEDVIVVHREEVLLICLTFRLSEQLGHAVVLRAGQTHEEFIGRTHCAVEKEQDV